MTDNLHFPKRKAVEGEKTGQEGKRQLTQDCYLVADGTETHPGFLAFFLVLCCQEISRTITYWELLGECCLPNYLAHAMFYGKSLYLWKSEKEFCYINDESEVHFVLLRTGHCRHHTFIGSPGVGCDSVACNTQFCLPRAIEVIHLPTAFLFKAVLHRATHQRPHLLR